MEIMTATLRLYVVTNIKMYPQTRYRSREGQVFASIHTNILTAHLIPGIPQHWAIV